MRHVGEFLRQERIKQGLTLQALARKIGYRNLNKGARRLGRLERTGQEPAALRAPAAQALGIDPIVVAEMAARDEQTRKAQFDAWANEAARRRAAEGARRDVNGSRVVVLQAAVAAQAPIAAGVSGEDQAGSSSFCVAIT